MCCYVNVFLRWRCLIAFSHMYVVVLYVFTPSFGNTVYTSFCVAVFVCLFMCIGR